MQENGLLCLLKYLLSSLKLYKLKLISMFLKHSNMIQNENIFQSELIMCEAATQTWSVEWSLNEIFVPSTHFPLLLTLNGIFTPLWESVVDAETPTIQIQKKKSRDKSKSYLNRQHFRIPQGDIKMWFHQKWTTLLYNAIVCFRIIVLVFLGEIFSCLNGDVISSTCRGVTLNRIPYDRSSFEHNSQIQKYAMPRTAGLETRPMFGQVKSTAYPTMNDSNMD